MLSNSKHQITHLGLVEESPPNGMAILQTPLGQDGFSIFRGDSMVKLCECGCGNPTQLAKWTDKKAGLKKGIPTRFINQHNFRLKREQCSNWKRGKTKGGNGRYDLIHMPGHPRATSVGYVLSHIVEAEKALGRFIPENIPIHHYNNKQLVICEDNSYHRILHVRTNALRKSGNAKYRKCMVCGKYDAIENMHKRKGRNAFYHTLCDNRRTKEQYLRKHDGNVRPYESGRKCIVTGCEKPYLSRGFCMTHYGRFKRNGTLFSKSDIPQKSITAEILVERK